jgi:hypothetical protein
MAKGREQFLKRQRERDRKRKAEEKRQRRAERRADKDGEGDGEGVDGEPTTPALSEDELLEKVRILNERHAAGEVDAETFEEQRADLFEQLGIE